MPTIATLTMNPALDLSSSAEVVAPTHKLRCAPARSEPGGGGVNVARVCKRLGEQVVAVAPLGGSAGGKVEELLSKEEIPTRITKVTNDTRQSISIFESSTGDEFRFVLPGHGISFAEIERCKADLIEVASDSRCVVISGSMPPGVDGRIFTDLASALSNTVVIIDTAGPALRTALESGCYLVKPSARELSYLTGTKLTTEADIESAAQQLISHSKIDVMVVSIGPGGAIAVTGDGPSIRVRAPTVRVKSTIGAGDSMIAGIATGLNRQLPLEESISLGVAAGTATVMTDGTMLCQSQEVYRLLQLVSID